MAKYDAEAFHFPDQEQHGSIPGLTDAVHGLWNEGRRRSALDLILWSLRSQGRSAEVFRMALTLLSTIRATPDPDVAEPVTADQFRNPYFAPIASECARCTAFWYSGHVLTSRYRGMMVLNPLGHQCPVCRYTLCRKCFTPEDAQCPEPGCSGGPGQPVLPTGRPGRMPANQHTEKVEHVLVLWHGTMTSPAELDDLLDLTCTWQDFGGITVKSVEVAERDLTVDTGLMLVSRDEAEGSISQGALDRTRCTSVDSPDHGLRLLFITAAPATGPASQLSGPVKHTASSARPRKRGWFRRR